MTAEQMAEYQRKRADEVRQLQSIQEINKSGLVKKCPQCKTGIEKSSGCNKMHCSNCHAKFCWLCLEVIDDYNHFWTADAEGTPLPGKCAGKLFEGVETALYDPYFLRDQRRERNAPNIGHGHGAQLTICPKCKQNNLKEGGNNHITCWNCRGRYCFLCRATANTTKHFGPGTCPQHS